LREAPGLDAALPRTADAGSHGPAGPTARVTAPAGCLAVRNDDLFFLGGD
jgi:hypothetical protein